MKDSVCLWAAAASLLLMSGIAGAQTASNVVCTGCVGTADLGNNSVTTQKIADGTIRAADIANQAVNSAKIKNGTVALVDLAPEIQEYVNATIAEIYLSLAYDEGEGIMGVSCPENSIPISSSCACNGDGVGINFGVLDFCAVIELEGAVASCNYDALTYDANLSPPTAQVQAVCLSGETNDGSPWVPGVVLPAGSSPIADGKGPLHGPMTDMQSVMAKLRTQRAAYDARLLRKGK